MLISSDVKANAVMSGEPQTFNSCEKKIQYQQLLTYIEHDKTYRRNIASNRVLMPEGSRHNDTIYFYFIKHVQSIQTINTHKLLPTI